MEFLHAVGVAEVAAGGLGLAPGPRPVDVAVQPATCRLHHLPAVGVLLAKPAQPSLRRTPGNLHRHPRRRVVAQLQPPGVGGALPAVAAGGHEGHREVGMLQTQAPLGGHRGDRFNRQRNGSGRGHGLRQAQHCGAGRSGYPHRAQRIPLRAGPAVQPVSLGVRYGRLGSDGGVDRDGLPPAGVLLAGILLASCGGPPPEAADAHRPRPVLQVALHVLVPQVAPAQGSHKQAQHHRKHPTPSRLHTVSPFYPFSAAGLCRWPPCSRYTCCI